jgi:hypothetical protein
MSTVFVTICDAPYFDKAVRTIQDLRIVGEWSGPIVLIAVDFTPDSAFCECYGVQVVSFPRIPTNTLIAEYSRNPLSIPTHDRREFTKVTQWEKLHVFDSFFQAWERVVYLDAGLRILDTVENFLCLEWKGKFLAPDDTWNDANKRFRCQLEMTNNPSVLQSYVETYGEGVLNETYFLNCMWIYDTAILSTPIQQEMLECMNRFPLWRTNEMGVMNTILVFQHRLWAPFPLTARNGKYLFDWCELNRPSTHWKQYCVLKYPVTIGQ